MAETQQVDGFQHIRERKILNVHEGHPQRVVLYHQFCQLCAERQFQRHLGNGGGVTQPDTNKPLYFRVRNLGNCGGVTKPDTNEPLYFRIHVSGMRPQGFQKCIPLRLYSRPMPWALWLS